MEDKPIVARITIFPIKSLDGVSLVKGVIAEGGCLLHDREYAIVDLNGNFVIGKTNPLVHSLRSAVDLENELVSFRHQEEKEWNQFHLQKDKLAIHAYLTDFFGTPVQLHQNKTGRFLDIPDTSGITLLSTESLRSVAGWFNNLDFEETRKRFRATVEIENVQPFWEDNLFSKKGIGVAFTVGEVTLLGVSPRARCVVPTRNPETGNTIHAFPKTFARHRAESLPEWSNLEEFGHHYYLSVDCYIPSSEVGKSIEIGDEVKIIGERILGPVS